MTTMWGNTDSTGNSVMWAPTWVHKAPTAAERDKLYGNTTANGYGTGETVGMYGVSGDEMQGVRAQGLPRPAAAGWVLRETGAGGRAGRVKNETLVAMHIGTGGAGDEDVAFPDYGLVVSIQPAGTVSGNSSANEIAKFNTNAYSVPTGASITYQWQKWGGASFANVANAGAYSNVTTKQLSVLSNTAANGETYRAGVYAAGAVTTYSANGVFIKTT